MLRLKPLSTSQEREVLPTYETPTDDEMEQVEDGSNQDVVTGMLRLDGMLIWT